MPTREEFIRARRAAEAFHVLWWIDHDGKHFVVTVGEPSEVKLNSGGEAALGVGLFAMHAATLAEAQALAAEHHDDLFRPDSLSRYMPAMKFHYTDAARAAAGLPPLVPG